MPRVFYEPDETAGAQQVAEAKELCVDTTAAYDIRTELIDPDDRRAQDDIWRRLPLTSEQRKIILAEYMEGSIEAPTLSRETTSALCSADFEDYKEPLPEQPAERKE